MRAAGSYPFQPHFNQPREDPILQIDHLDRLAAQEVPKVEISSVELDQKEAFKQQLEQTFQEALRGSNFDAIETISLVGFGSLASGFGLPSSDMDLAIVPVWKEASDEGASMNRAVPRLFEQVILDSKMGGRLLTRTRVPILKICQNPTETLYTALLEERKKWDNLPFEEQYPSGVPIDFEPQPKPQTDNDTTKSNEVSNSADSRKLSEPPHLANIPNPNEPSKPTDSLNFSKESPELSTKASPKIDSGTNGKVEAKPLSDVSAAVPDATKAKPTGTASNKEQQNRSEKPWMREKIIGPLDFPKNGVGIQCDVNFENPLGIHNSHMLRCYSLTDPRVRPIVLFVKSWAKTRKINSAYSGTLSSYGWVLMVLHYLVNVAQPPVCPNLQHSIPPPTDLAGLETFCKQNTVSGYSVRYWNNEQDIIQAAQTGRLSQNRQTIGALLRGFFQYFASPGYTRGPRPPQFYWTTEVLSLQVPGGIQTKQEKGWTAAKTHITAEKKVTNRYLFAIEDPFEIDHNVARTVTHPGIVAIRDEFRRAWRILRAIGLGQEPEGGIFDEIVENVTPPVSQLDAQDESKNSTKKEASGSQSEDWPPLASPGPT